MKGEYWEAGRVPPDFYYHIANMFAKNNLILSVRSDEISPPQLFSNDMGNVADPFPRTASRLTF
jgi:hypothetical protein